MTDPAALRVAAYTPDLMDRSKIAAVVPGCRFVARPEALVGLAGVDVVVVDLSRRGALDVLPELARGPARLVAYGSHVDRELLAGARSAGCEEVLARSQFFTKLPQLLV